MRYQVYVIELKKQVFTENAKAAMPIHNSMACYSVCMWA
jgi:hypothetical protein